MESADWKMLLQVKILISCEGLRHAVAYFSLNSDHYFSGWVSLGRNEKYVFDLGEEAFEHGSTKD